MLNYIYWDVSPKIISIGSFELRYYGLLFAGGFVIGYYIMMYIFKKESIPLKELDTLTTYAVIATIVGARLGHIIFYQPMSYIHNPIEILKVWHGGLASHGGTIGLLIALYFFSKKSTKKSYMWVLDRFVVPTAFVAFCIRMGNLMNSEIYGKETTLPWGFIFAQNNETTPKHPTQIYEALAYLLTFFLLLFIYNKSKYQPKKGLLFGIFLTGIFGFRFFIEFIKESQVGFEEAMVLNMGQLLSIPFIITGIFFIYKSQKRQLHK
ncbi:MAG: prolipoprotein diacylglyceryl transferase [Saprospiraceae bacterium]|nr:prolipoprotein diacylglyceryl transferase [Saprospiraceae bacterium]